MTLTDAERLAPKRKRALRRWVRRWNKAHPAQAIPFPKGFNPRTRRVGEPARELLKSMQRKAKLPHVSGQFDGPTLERLFPVSFRGRVLRMARSQLGAREWPAGSNWGPAVQKFLASVGIKSGAPWCAAFVTWVLKSCGYDGPLPSLPGFVPSWLSFAQAHGLVKPKRLCRAGDILIFDWPGNTSPADHIGFAFVNFGGLLVLLKTLEGNTGDHGGSVTYRLRSWGSIRAVIDTAKLRALQKAD